MKKKSANLTLKFEKFAGRITNTAGKPGTFMTALALIFVWLISGPLFHYSDTWQLVINTGTTIITFLMVFLIQQAQNKDSHSIQLKLNEVIASVNGASNRLINVEDLSDKEIEDLHRFYRELAKLSKQDISTGESHSVEEARTRHETKKKAKARI